MRDHKIDEIPILLAILLVLLSLSVSLVLAPGANKVDNAGGITEVVGGENFLLRYDLYWDQDNAGFFTVKIEWTCYENRENENFTFLRANAYFYSGGPHDDGHGGENIENISVTFLATPSDNDTKYSVEVITTEGDPRNGDFYVDIWLGAWGAGGIFHVPTDNHEITSSLTNPDNLDPCIIVAEDIPFSHPTHLPITVKVPPPPAGVEVYISPENQSGLNGATLSYTITVTNTGTFSPDNYDLTVGDDAGWGDNIWLDNYRLDNTPPGENGTTTLRVRIPGNAVGGTEDNIWVKATSHDNAAVFDSESCLAHVTISRGVSVSISPSSQSGLNEVTLTYTVTVNNTGNVSDNYALTVGDNAGWLPSVSPTSRNVSAGGNRTATLTVTVPDNAVANTRDNITVSATSTENTNVWAENSCIANAIENIIRGVDVSISPSEKSAENGRTVTFTVTIRNTGNVTENYDLSKTDDAGWGAWLDENMLTIPAGENTTVTVSVTVPSDASEGDSTMITVTATSQENAQVENSATCTAQAILIIRGVDVSISPSENSAENGRTVTFTVTIRNTGNVTENYDLSKTDDAGWTLTLQSSVTVPSGKNRKVTLTVGIPATAENDTLDNITVTAISSENSAVSDSATCVAHCVVSVTPQPPGTFPFVYVGAVVIIVVIIAAVLILKPF